MTAAAPTKTAGGAIAPRAGAHMGGISRPAYSSAAIDNSQIAVWRPKLTSVDAEVLRDGPTIRARARDLVRNNPYAKHAVRISRIATVGSHMRLKLRPDWRFLGLDYEISIKWAREVERVWRAYSHGTHFWIDAGRRATFTDMMNLVHDQDFVDGECLVATEWDERRPWYTCFQVVDVDRLSNPTGVPEQSHVKGGVELDHLGAPIAYHIRNAHPAEYGMQPSMQQMTWSRVPRETEWYRPVIMHSFDATRAAQTRGVSEFASAITALKMGHEFAEQELATSAARSTYLAVLTTAANVMQAMGMVDDAATFDAETNELITGAQLAFQQSVEYANELGLSINGQKIPKLAPGDKLEFVNPRHTSSAYSEFVRNQLHGVAAGLGVDPIALTQDYSKANYASNKMSFAHNGRAAETRRGRLIRTVAMPMVSSWLEEAIARQIIDMPPGLTPGDFYAAKDALCNGTFITASKAMLEPLKERQAQQMARAMGAETSESICADEGEDFEENIEQIARENAIANEYGVLLPGMLPPMQAPLDDGVNDGDGTDDESGDEDKTDPEDDAQ